jgi:hypothetical protein
VLKPNKEVVDAILALKSRQPKDWDVLVSWLAAERDDARNNLEKQRDDIALRQDQGRAQVLSEFLATDAAALELIKKFRTPT